MNRRIFNKTIKLFPFVLIFLVSTFIAPLCFAQETASLSDIYIVLEGDTLWDISSRFYGDPFLWPNLWEKNPHIRDPHWIYPGQIINLRDVPLAPLKKYTYTEATPPAKEKRPERLEQRIETAPKPNYIASDEMVNSCSYIIPIQLVKNREKTEGWGNILKSKEKKISLSYLDHIFVDYGEQHVKTGQLLTVFSIEKQIKTLPALEGKYNMIKILGQAEVIEVYPEFSLARIIKSFDAINVGNRVKPYEAMPRPTLKYSALRDLRGALIASEEPKEYLSEYDIVFLNIGKRDGLEPGNPLEIYRLEDVPLNPSTNQARKVIEPLGVLFIIRVEEETATGLISKSVLPIALGDQVKLTSKI